MKAWRYLTVLASAFLIAGCAHQKSIDRKVDQELAQQKPVELGGPLAAESRRMIDESKELTQEQKDKLLALHARMATEVRGFREEEGRLKMVFFKTLLDPKSKEAEVNNLKSRILKLDRRKTDKMLSALEEARKILGRIDLNDDSLIYRAFLGERVEGFN